LVIRFKRLLLLLPLLFAGHRRKETVHCI